ncbi:MAG: YdbH domain-containing protein [Kangiellaceae bacterium]|nr:YdbH domain-containing protein [Kangiellaceae bacterium]
MKGNLKKGLFFAIAIVALAYLTAPWWLAIVVQRKLPPNVNIESISINYPGLSGLTVEELTANVDNTSIAVSELKMDYSVSYLSIDSIMVSLTDSNTAQPIDIGKTIKGIVGTLDSLARDAAIFELLPNVDINAFMIKSANGLIGIRHIQLNRVENKIELILPESKYETVFESKSNQQNQIIDTNNRLREFTDLTVVLDYNNKVQELTLDVRKNTNSLFLLEYSHSTNLSRLQLNTSKESLKEFLQENGLKYLDVFEKNISASIEFYPVSDEVNIRATNRLLIDKATLTSLYPEGVSLEEALSAVSVVELKFDKSNGQIKDGTLEQESKYSGLIKVAFDLEKAVSISAGEKRLNIEELKIDSTLPFELTMTPAQRYTLNTGDAEFTVSSKQIEISQIGTSEQPKYSSVLTEVELTSKANFEAPIKDTSTNFDWSATGQITTAGLKVGYADKDAKQSDQALDFTSEASVTFDLAATDKIVGNGRIELSSLSSDFVGGNIMGQTVIDWSNIDSTLSQGEIKIALDSNLLQLGDFSFNSFNAESKFVIYPDSIKGLSKFRINGTDLAPVSINFDREHEKFVANIDRTTIALPLVNQLLTQLGKKRNIPLEIPDGVLAHSTNATVKDSLHLLSILSMNDARFLFGENEVHGLNVTQEITSISPIRFKGSVSIDSIDFSSGMKIEELTADISGSEIEQELTFYLRNVDAKILEGKLQAKFIEILDGDITESKVELTKLSLTELVFFMDVAGLYADGEMNFTLPVSTKKGQLTIDKGMFKATREGIIKYSNGEPESDDENIALKALRNFHYTSLDGDVSYNETGQYIINLHLQGANPSLYGGHPIDFELNLKGELSGVFRSLFLTGNFEEAVLEQVKTNDTSTLNSNE